MMLLKQLYWSEILTLRIREHVMKLFKYHINNQPKTVGIITKSAMKKLSIADRLFRTQKVQRVTVEQTLVY